MVVASIGKKTSLLALIKHNLIIFMSASILLLLQGDYIGAVKNLSAVLSRYITGKIYSLLYRSVILSYIKDEMVMQGWVL